jgi:hypothetical protein
VFVDIPYQQPGIVAPHVDRMGRHRGTEEIQLPAAVREVEMRSVDVVSRGSIGPDDDGSVEQAHHAYGEVWQALPMEPTKSM